MTNEVAGKTTESNLTNEVATYAGNGLGCETESNLLDPDGPT